MACLASVVGVHASPQPTSNSFTASEHWNETPHCLSHVKLVAYLQNKKIMNQIPHEFSISGIYLPPLLIVSILGVFLALITAKLLNRYHLSKYFFYPPLVLLALMIIYTVIIGTFFIRG